jgi:hypothetical protein
LPAGDRTELPRRLVHTEPRRIAKHVSFLLVFLALLSPGAPAMAAAVAGPLPSECDQVPPVPFPDAGEAPLARVWKSSADGLPPRAACMAHGEAGAELWVSVAALGRDAESTESLVARFGQISQLRQVKYWSITDQRWRPLFASATALTGAAGKQRDDFSAEELEQGAPLYFEQADSRSSHRVIYELRLLRSDRQGFIVSTINVSPVQWWGVTLYKPGELSTLYFLDHARADQWRFYSLSRMALGSGILSVKDGSYINRAVALYRFFLGIPTDAEPPASR